MVYGYTAQQITVQYKVTDICVGNAFNGFLNGDQLLDNLCSRPTTTRPV